MAANLTAEQLAALQPYLGGSGYGTGMGSSRGGYVDPTTGMSYTANYSMPTSLENGDASGQFAGIYGVDPAHSSPGDMYNVYDANGNYKNSSVINASKATQDFLTFLAVAMSMGTLAPMMMGGEAAAGAAGGAAGLAGDATAAGSGGALGANGAFLGEGVSSGIPAWDAAYGNALAGTAAGGGLASSGSGVSTDAPTLSGVGGGGSNPASAYDYQNGSDLMTSNFDGSGAAGAGGGFGGGSSGGSGSSLSSLTSSLGPYAQYLAPLLGAIVGSHPQTTTTSSQHTMDPRMNGYVYGDGGSNPGILGYTQSLLNQQMQPGALQGYTDMQNVGRGLLNQPIAGNGFSRFFGGR